MTAREVTPVIGTMAAAGWTVGCLYNQEIGESPQLFHSHLFKIGNALTLAHQIRRGLDHTAARRP